MVGAANSAFYLICRSEKSLCALPLDCVAETMRPLPLEALPNPAPGLLGVAIIRASAVPVVDMAQLTGSDTHLQPGRYVSLNVGKARQVALAVGEVIGVRELDNESLSQTPPLLRDAALEVISAISLLDAELMLVMQAGRLVPESVWADMSMQVSAT
jgi:purine-binding chemotaxis protein CheW